VTEQTQWDDVTQTNKIEKPKAQQTQKKDVSIQRDVTERGNFSFLTGTNYCSTQIYLQLPD
jgi:hypothetical protein